MKSLGLCLAVILTAPAWRSAGASELRLQKAGSISRAGEGTFKTYRIAVGDTNEQNRSSVRSFMGEGGYGAMNGTLYINKDSTKIPVQDGTWIVENHGRPPDRALSDPRGLEERKAYIEYLFRPDVRRFLESPTSYRDFGEPGDPFYKRFSIAQSDIPAPFNRLSRATLVLIEAILQYNVDKTSKAYFRGEAQEEGRAQRNFESLGVELGKEFCPFDRLDAARDRCLFRCAKSASTYETRTEWVEENDPKPAYCAQAVIPL